MSLLFLFADSTLPFKQMSPNACHANNNWTNMYKTFINNCCFVVLSSCQPNLKFFSFNANETLKEYQL